MKINDLIEILQTLKTITKGHSDCIWKIEDFEPNGKFVIHTCKGYKEFNSATMQSDGPTRYFGVSIDCENNKIADRSIEEISEDEVDDWCY